MNPDKEVSPNGMAEVLKTLEAEVANSPSSVIAHHRLALGLLRAGRYDDAARSFIHALDIDPNSFEIRVNLGSLYFQLRRFEEGIEENKKALAVYPRSAEAMANIGAGFIQLGRWDDAASYFRQALSVKPEMVPAWTNLVTVLVELGSIDDAVAAGRKAVSLAPTFPLAHNNLAVALFHKGDFDEARQHLEEAKRLGYPVHPEFEERLSKEEDAQGSKA